LIESSADTSIETSSFELRAKTKRKCKKTHFYALNGEVERIKTIIADFKILDRTVHIKEF
jgi:hypothetical protein